MNVIFAAAGAAHEASHVTMNGEGLFNFWLIIALMMTGLYLILSRSNMIKTIIGLNFFQASVIMLYVALGRVDGGTAPILMGDDVPHDETHETDHGGDHGADHGKLIDADKSTSLASTTPAMAAKPKSEIAHSPSTATRPQPELRNLPTQSRAAGIVYSNPLPHVLMLTAIVVGVATTALALSLVVRINEEYGTIEEDEVAAQEVMS